MASNRKIEEGLEHVKNAEKSLKTGLLKWRPDYENAADEFNKAATCFRNAKSYQQCKDCLLKAADCHKQNRGLFYAAKALDQCISICKEMGDLRDIYSMAERAAHMFQSQGSPDSASSILEKAAKILESNVPMEALNLYKHAAEIAQIQDNQRQAAEFTSKVARLHVKLLQYDQAADAIRREIGIHQANESIQALGRLVVALVLVQLARGDIVAAEKAFKEWGNYCDPSEIQNLEMLLQAYDEEDRENAQRALNDPFIKHMDVEYAILARDLPLPQGAPASQKKPIVENAAGEYKRVRPQNDEYVPTEARGAAEGSKEPAEEDEYEGGLC
ncbi:gamma-soluble NSF attachment protein-like isoform X1 [Anthonomus grandis grandis]|uniref:gamma-soluble NSF attachment protein-like isoform X1 n=1 Tax=Anthonomus grandis grandis TaxID=2921223 RepID=UPI00216625EE|nr:gamma-soluble NSF attachment protein-like isoform X1 [Anthonomus grandis grandis]